MKHTYSTLQFHYNVKLSWSIIQVIKSFTYKIDMIDRTSLCERGRRNGWEEIWFINFNSFVIENIIEVGYVCSGDENG